MVQRCDVSQLEHDEDVRLDSACLIALYRDLGPLGAESVLSRAMSEIARRLDGLSEPYRSGCWRDLARNARSLSAISEQVGMRALARVARDVASCATWGDAAGLGATLARLDRIAHRSLAAVWDMTGTDV
ncbi:MAG: hypothetical protein AAGG09_11440 [Pseudomonadota bacterium]